MVLKRYGYLSIILNFFSTTILLLHHHFFNPISQTSKALIKFRSFLLKKESISYLRHQKIHSMVNRNLKTVIAFCILAASINSQCAKGIEKHFNVEIQNNDDKIDVGVGSLIWLIRLQNYYLTRSNSHKQFTNL